MTICKIEKRNGTTVDFDQSKIVAAIENAMKETSLGVDTKLAWKIAEEVEKHYQKEEVIPSVETVSDKVEELLAVAGRFDVSRRYILYRGERAKIRNTPWTMSELQKDIYENKYRYEDEGFAGFIDRVSGKNPQVGKIIRDKDFVFAGRILAGRGLNRNVTLSNCYVLPQPQDNLESIFDAAKESARTYSYGGGVGFDISLLRAAGAKVNNSALTTSGPVSFMELYSLTTEIIGQRGRRGALMLSMDIDHDDIIAFVNSKRDLAKVTSANISVRSNDNFFKEYLAGKAYEKVVMEELAKSNWQSGEPGMLFWDRVQQWHLLQHHPEYKLYSTNPCGEQPLPPYGACLLGSLNLSNFVLNPFTQSAVIDFDRLREVTKIAVIGLDEVLDEGIKLHPLPEQRETAKKFRQIGLGVMSLADMFIKLGIEYGSEDSIKISAQLGECIRDAAFEQSVELAKRDGPYPAFNAEIVSKSDFFKSLPNKLQVAIAKYGTRHSHVLSIAPTGL